jgi:hypothetical protein
MSGKFRFYTIFHLEYIVTFQSLIFIYAGLNIYTLRNIYRSLFLRSNKSNTFLPSKGVTFSEFYFKNNKVRTIIRDGIVQANTGLH